jgi:hypothetical protein
MVFKRASYSIARICYSRRVFVCPSVRPSSVRMSRSELQGLKFSIFARNEVLVKYVVKCKNQT